MPYTRKADRRRHERYGLTPTKFHELLDQQGNACAVCARPFTLERRPEIDHKHGSPCPDCVRGAVCHYCNTLIRWFEQDWSAGIYLLAKSYVNRHDRRLAAS
jgi:hypothetical protein